MSDEVKKGMTVQEAGRLGGKKVVATYGSEHMSQIGKAGGSVSPTRFKAGSEETKRIAKLGGQNSTGNFGKDPTRAAEAGRKGGAARAAKRKAAREQSGSTMSTEVESKNNV